MSDETIMVAKRPRNARAWACTGRVGPAVRWKGPHGVIALSELAIAELPDGAGVGPQWLVSISIRGQRASDAICARVLANFGLAGAEEDNHEPGIARCHEPAKHKFPVRLGLVLYWLCGPCRAVVGEAMEPPKEGNPT